MHLGKLGLKLFAKNIKLNVVGTKSKKPQDKRSRSNSSRDAVGSKDPHDGSLLLS